MKTHSQTPLKLYGSSISYFTGKLENYFRIKDIPYQLHSMQAPRDFKKVKRATGVEQMPAVELPDGRWMTDSTKIIQWFEEQHPETPIFPQDSVLAFLSLLLEDYADEWLWRPAMHYRWYYKKGAELQSRHLTDELMSGIRLPGSLKRFFLRRRQKQGYTWGDGITRANVAGVEDIYLRILDKLEVIFKKRKFMLGDTPSVADIGFSGPFFRHFGLDPIPLEIMKQRAPAVFEWTARLWNFKLSPDHIITSADVPSDLGSLLDEIGNSYLPYLNANVEAVQSGKQRFDAQINGVAYRGARYSKYRVWCLQELRSRFDNLPVDAAAKVKQLLEQHHCWTPLWQHESLPLSEGQEAGLPFAGNSKMVGVNE